MAGGDGGERRNDGALGLLHLHPVEPPELDMLFSRYVLFLTYMLMATTGIGYLALTWSTVVLLGGFVTALQRKDFWCLTIISMMQAARIFNDLGDQMLPNFFDLVGRFTRHNSDLVRHEMWVLARTFQRLGFLGAVAKWSTWAMLGFILHGVFVVLPFTVLCYVPALFYLHGGPIACIALALWRIAQRDYGADAGDKSQANLTPALDMFYALVLLQGVLFFAWLTIDSWWVGHLVCLRDLCKLPNTRWCHLALIEYLLDTEAKCWRDLSSIRGRKVIHYAVELLDSGASMEANLTGLRLLDAFIRQGTVDLRSLLHPSRPKVQKLLDMLAWNHGPHDGEMRRLSAHILAHLAGDIHLAQFPGAIQCISSLLQDEEPASAEQQQQIKLPAQIQTMLLRLEKEERKLGASSDDDDRGGGHCNELILHGLTILERLASDHHNCREICSTPGLLRKITAPLYSDTLIKDMSIRAWADVVIASFGVVRRLIRAPGKMGKRLRREISSNKQAVSNLESILNHRRASGQELSKLSLEMLTELALDSSANLASTTKQNLIDKQLQIFFRASEGRQGPATLPDPLQVTAGRTLVLMTANSQIMASPYHDNILALTSGFLGTKKNFMYRTIAAEILENLCTHCDWNKYKQILTESLLPKVLTEIMSIRSDQPESRTCEEKENKPRAWRWIVFNMINDLRNKKRKRKNSVLGIDEENQQSLEQSQKDCEPQDQNEIKEFLSSSQQDEEASPKELQEALLSLALAICVKLIGAGDVVQMNALGGDAFVLKLKTIIDDNCLPTANSLRIVRLCSQIAAAMMKSPPYTEHYFNEFLHSLSKASKIMSSLESCVMFSGTDFGLKKTVRPLLSEVVSELD